MKKFNLPELYENVKLLHEEIFAFYCSLQTERLETSETKELEQVIYASRDIFITWGLLSSSGMAFFSGGVDP